MTGLDQRDELVSHVHLDVMSVRFGRRRSNIQEQKELYIRVSGYGRGGVGTEQKNRKSGCLLDVDTAKKFSMKRQKLDPKDDALLGYIFDRLEELSAPTPTEVQVAMDFLSVREVHGRLEGLRQRGFLHWRSLHLRRTGERTPRLQEVLVPTARARRWRKRILDLEITKATGSQLIS